MNKDVLHLIFEHFDFQPGSPTAAQTRKDLFSAARTCKAFVEPALNSLWRIIPSLLPLLLLLPSAEVSNNYFFADDLSINNWERFEIHARRVRSLYMEPSRVIIPPTTYLRICGLRDTCVLPGLTEIYIPDNTSLDLSSIMLLVLGAPLNAVELNNKAVSDRSFFMPFLTLLASKSPQIRHLTLRGTGNMPSKLAYWFTSLQRLEIRFSGTYLYPQTLRRLGNLTNLHDLTLDAGAAAPPPAIAISPPTSPSSYGNFKSLRRLHVIGIPGSITRILDDINLTSLITLVIDETPEDAGRHTEISWKRLFNQISVCNAIEDIEINQHAQRRWGHEHFSLSTSWFSPLFNLKNVKNLVINGSALSGSDEDFRQLAGAFPKLRKLVVPPEYYSQGRTLACLFYFSQECPDLREIRISLISDVLSNLDAVKKLPPHTIPANHQHPLEKLYISAQFGQIQPTHMVPIAQFLDLVFPNISILEAYNNSTAVEISNWTGIQEIRVALQDTWLNVFRQITSKTDIANMESKN
ncbi:hypothetical protein BYT27DRAFT_7113611 [Phlegmacium glaucopus]|nr:hypothetical protein BYT27DRAFT_7113611 [Phlegmacium glaucopus]